MSEMAKTILLIAVAGVSLAVAFASGPSTDVQNLDALVGERLNQFEVEDARRLKIVKFDSDTAETREFEVAENDGLWTIPSKQDYPADAAQQMGEAATVLIDREVLRVAGKNADSHEEFGVVDPSRSSLDSKAEGVGTRVSITDANDKTLADMIIGKPVKEAAGQYFARNADQDVVVVMNLAPEKLSTKFEDWIEDDLLQLSPMDIRRVTIKDYSAELQPVLTAAGLSMQVSWDRRGEFELAFDPQGSKWEPVALQEFDPESKELVPFELDEAQQLNDAALGELRTALDDLKLVDVERKPAGLSADLKGGSDFLKNQDAARSLVAKGFAPLSLEQGAPPEILSTEGEIVCAQDNGVEYVLRFGNLQIGEEGESTSGEPSASAAGETTEDGDKDTDDNSDDGINRYLFVMARFNESMIEKPKPQELPELPPEVAEEEEEEEVAIEDETEDETEKDTAEDTDEETTEETEEETAEDTTKETEEETDSDAPREDASDDTSDDASEADRDAILAAREAIEKENERQQNEYNDKIEAGRKRVAELNQRFGDWYYVISNDVYKKIHLGRDDLIQKKGDEKPATPPGPPGGGIPGLPNLPLGN